MEPPSALKPVETACTHKEEPIYLKDLNARQKEAVLYNQSPLMIVAGFSIHKLFLLLTHPSLIFLI